MSTSSKHILITGYPGVGKTTLVKKLCDKLREMNKKLDGFYTEELRSNNFRIGFDVVTLDGKRGQLARTMGSLDPNTVETKYKLGQYVVFPKKFEELAMTLFKTAKEVFVIDEIGKMELFSDIFRKEIENLFKTSNACIVATIPVQKGRPIPTVELIRNLKSTKLFTVDKTNRNNILEEILLYFNS